MFITGMNVFTVEPHAGLKFVVRLRCLTCNTLFVHTVEEYSNIWRWGLDQSIETKLKSSLRDDPSQYGPYPAPREFECEHCGTTSRVSIHSIDALTRNLSGLIGHLHEGIGAPWALAKLEEFMAEHLQENGRLFPSSCYSFDSCGHNNEFLLRLCPCDRCEKDRAGHPRIKKLEEKHFNLSRFPIPEKR